MSYSNPQSHNILWLPFHRTFGSNHPISYKAPNLLVGLPPIQFFIKEREKTFNICRTDGRKVSEAEVKKIRGKTIDTWKTQLAESEKEK